MMKALPVLLVLTGISSAGPYSPGVGVAGTTAISKDDLRFINWASGYQPPQYGAGVDAQFKTPNKALGKAIGDSFDIVCLGDSGSITMWFPFPIRDGAGADFAVFENSFSSTFLELGFVEVSSDGANFHRFATRSLTAMAVGGFGNVDPTNIDGLAGKYKQGYGTPFDLAALPDSPLLDKQNVRFVRIVDILGNGSVKDSANNPIYDPYPTTGSAGFDLDAIGVINQNTSPARIVTSAVEPGIFRLKWETNPTAKYRVETSLALASWTVLENPTGSATGSLLERTFALSPTERGRFWRVVRVDP